MISISSLKLKLFFALNDLFLPPASENNVFKNWKRLCGTTDLFVPPPPPPPVPKVKGQNPARGI